MFWETVEHKNYPGEWVTEAIDYASEGEIYCALFSGPRAEERAKQYAAWKNA